MKYTWKLYFRNEGENLSLAFPCSYKNVFRLLKNRSIRYNSWNEVGLIKVHSRFASVND